jgi:catechol 2,3-dioxygenase-like lactoylglutathione lyase family enzyme
MNSESKEIKSGVGYCLQGVQHFGITVDDMNKSMEFYTELLGGKLVVSGDGFTGEVMHNTLFQQEDLEALERGIDPRTLGVPDLRDGSKEALDVRFISFGNTVLELIHFRDARLNPSVPNWAAKVSSCAGFANVMHLSFHVKDDVDLNRFAKDIEEECRRRKINFIANRIIRVRSEEERRTVALRYTANKFWNDPNPDYFVEGYSEGPFGDFEGWSLFYAKGPNGEQLEFNQVTRQIKGRFIKAQQEYNQATGTNYTWPSASSK